MFAAALLVSSAPALAGPASKAPEPLEAPRLAEPAALAPPLQDNESGLPGVVSDLKRVPEGMDDGADESWNGSVNLGGFISAGNAETTTLSFSADAQKQQGDDRYIAGVFYNYSEDGLNNETLQDNRGLDVEYNRFLDEDLYLLGQGSLYTDEVTDLNQRTTLGVGVGVQFFDDEKTAWNVEVGAALVDEDFVLDVDDNDFAAARVSTGLAWKVTDKVSYAQDFTGLQSLDEGDDYLLDNDSRISLNLTETMVASFQYVLAYNNTPAATFERTDHRFVATVGWTF